MFWILSALMAMIAACFVLFPLLHRRAQSPAERNSINIELFEERQASIEADIALDTDEKAVLIEDARRDLLMDVDSGQSISRSADTRITVLVVAALVIPLFALLLYADFGLGRGAMTDVLLTQALRNADPADEVRYRELIERFAERAAQTPENTDMQFLLARTYTNMGSYEEAAGLYSELKSQFPEDENLAGFYAETLFLLDGQKMTPRVSEAIEQAFELDPDNLTMLELKGIGAMMAGNIDKAAQYFERALATGVTGERALLIRQALKQLGVQDSSVVGRSIRVALSVAASITLPDTAVIFVFARAAGGPPAPLAVQRLVPHQLPAMITLDETMAMMPGMSLAEFDRVQVVARVSESGEVVAKPGDLEARSAVLEWSGDPVEIELVLEDRVE